jgi:imidazolonepropionase-like amidohydrolase
MISRSPKGIILTLILLSGLPFVLQSQTKPPDGIRRNTPRVHAFTNARIVQAPGKVIERGTLVIRDGVIVSVGATPAPADARTWDLTGQTIYPGLIDAFSDYGMPKPPATGETPQPQKPAEKRGPASWNGNILADQNAAELFSPDPKGAEKLRSQGFTAALVTPQRGIIKGTTALVSLGTGETSDLVIRSAVAQDIALAVSSENDDYPGSLMGVIALIRQTFLDADWYQKAHVAIAKNPSLPRPETNASLAALKEAATGGMPVIIETSDELDFLRGHAIGKEFSLNLIVRGNGQEYKRLDAIKATQRPVILPVNFPDVPAVQTPEEALYVSLEDLRYWDEAPENAMRLQNAGVKFAFTSATLKDPATFLAQVRKAVERGLSADAALAALTVTPANLFGVGKQLGSLEPGKAAHFIVTSGDLFEEKTVIRESWIDGSRYEVKPLLALDPRGKWHLTLSGRPAADTLTLTLKGEPDALQGTIKHRKETKLTTASLTGLTLSFAFPGDSVGLTGILRLSGTVSSNALTGTGEWSNGTTFSWSGTRVGPFIPDPDTSKPKLPVRASFPPVYPPGEFGRETVPVQQASVLVKGATIWTSGPQGRIENGDLLVQKGKIVSVGSNLRAPADALVVDGTGKHVTAGLIDAHSHMAASGSVNEAGQAISAEVRISDVVDCDDIDIYRALAGGLTAAHILHGSANPIGGQAQLIKLRWGMLPDEMKFDGVPPTIKFALGENVKQSNWGDRFTTRYPQTRMGVEQIMRDEFQAALDYEKAWQRFENDKSGIPPRRDLELDAVLEIVRGKRFVHCHSYRQDEILAMMRAAESFGFRVRVFQHILEGYKVADVMAQHGAGGSSFSDWWGYKLEVYDAIPYNGALMRDQGVLVSFNSDSDELARRMNLEAAKAVKYGGVPPEEALRFVTINPAHQLKVENRIGSLEPGKDADFVLWSGDPLSTYSICEQTWIDGRKFFDRQEDRELYAEVLRQRGGLIQKALTTRKSGTGDTPPKPPGKGDMYDHPHLDTDAGEGY